MYDSVSLLLLLCFCFAFFFLFFLLCFWGGICGFCFVCFRLFVCCCCFCLFIFFTNVLIYGCVFWVLWLYGVRYMVKDHSDNMEYSFQLAPRDLYMTFYTQDRTNIPRRPLHQSWNTGWTEK